MPSTLSDDDLLLCEINLRTAAKALKTPGILKDELPGFIELLYLLSSRLREDRERLPAANSNTSDM